MTGGQHFSRSQSTGTDWTSLTEQAETMIRLWRHPYGSRERIRRFQEEKLRLLLGRAYERVAHYRRRFEEAGVDPSSVRSAADLIRLPVTTKADFRTQPIADLVARGVDVRQLLLR